MKNTKPIPLFGIADAARVVDLLHCLRSCNRCSSVPTCGIDTLFAAWEDVSAATVTMLVALRQARADQQSSRPVDLAELRAALHHDIGKLVAPFQHRLSPPLETNGGTPADAPWNKKRRKIRQAARAYSEHTHADY
jgi:hypothetical protein